MTTQEQTNIVKKALDLSIFIAEKRKVLNEYLSANFRSKPVPPTRQIITATYPEIISTVKFWSPILLITLFFSPFPIIYYFWIYKPKKEADIERIRYSEEYRRKCADIDEDVKKRQKAIDEAFEKATQQYNEVKIPTWEKEKAAWEADIKHKIDEAQSALNKAEKELEELYISTKIVPLQYRSINALQYIYNTMSTSEYNIQSSIELYDKERQRQLDERNIHEQQVANQLAREQNQLSYEQNELLDRQNDIADRARKEAAVANIIGTVQHHNTNKALNKIVKK